MLPANVITAPKLPRHDAKPTIAPTSTPGVARGNVMLKKRSSDLAPSVRAASSNFGSTASNESRIARTMSGKAVTAQARAAPVVVNTSRTPNHDCNHGSNWTLDAKNQEQKPSYDDWWKHHRKMRHRIENRAPKKSTSDK